MGLSRTQVASLCCYPGRLRIPLPMIPLFSAPSARVAVHLEESSLPVQFSFHIIIFLEFLFGHFCDFPTWRPFPSLSSSQHSGLFVTFGSIVSGLSIGCSVLFMYERSLPPCTAVPAPLGNTVFVPGGSLPPNQLPPSPHFPGTERGRAALFPLVKIAFRGWVFPCNSALK